VLDIERGQLSGIRPLYWQTDTSISNRSWGYIENDTFKSPEFIVHQLVDIVSKNGNLLLNIGPRSDGTIPDEVQQVLREVGAWLKVNGDAIYGTRPWRVYGEGPTKVVEGAFHDTDIQSYTAEDFRFTSKGDTLFAIELSWPANRDAVIHSLAAGIPGEQHVESVELVGPGSKLPFQQRPDAPSFRTNIDGYFLPESVEAIFAAGKQSHVPLLAGWNADEDEYQSIFEKEEPSPENFAARVRELYGSNADTILKLYPATTVAQAKRAAADLAGDRFTALHTWKWMELQLRTGKSPVYRYHFEETLPLAAGTAPSPDNEPTAPHASEIEFVFQVLSSRDLPWRPQDEKISDLMGSYWTNFAKTGDPNAEGLPHWPVYGPDAYEVMHLGPNLHALPDEHRARYEFLDKIQ